MAQESDFPRSLLLRLEGLRDEALESALDEVCGEDQSLREQLLERVAELRQSDAIPTPMETPSGAMTLEDGAGSVSSQVEQLRRDAAPPPASIAVLPFLNSGGDPEEDYLGDGLSEEVIHELTGVEGLKVAARTSSFRFKSASLPAAEVGRRLGVRWVLEGSFADRGDRLEVQARLVEVRTEDELWNAELVGQSDELFELQAETARAVVDRLHKDLVGSAVGRKDVSRPRTSSREAYALVLKGRFYWHQRHQAALEESLACFEAAVEADSDFVLAHVGVADACWSQAAYLLKPQQSILPRGRLAAMRALQLDDSLAEVHAARGAIALFELDWRVAESSFMDAIGLNEAHALSHSLYGQLLGLRRRRVPALTEMARALELEPMSQFYCGIGALSQYLLGDFAQAVDMADRGLEIDELSFLCLWVKGLSLVELERVEEGVQWLHQAADRAARPVSAVSWLAYAYGRLGNTARAKEHLAELEERGRSEFVHKAWMATAHLGLGRLEEAEELFLQTLYEGAPSYVFALYGRPFPRLLELIGLPA